MTDITIKTKQELVLFATNLIHIKAGFVMDDASYRDDTLVELRRHGELIYTSVKLVSGEDKYLVTTNLYGKNRDSISTIISYDEFFKDVDLPITLEQLIEKSNNFEHYIKYLLNLGINVPDKSNDEEDLINSIYDRLILEKLDGEIIATLKSSKPQFIGYELFFDNQTYDIKELSKDTLPTESFTPTKITLPTIHNSNTIESKTSSELQNIPKFDDEYEILQNKPVQNPNRSIPSIGESDLNPLGSSSRHPVLKPYLSPGDYNPIGEGGFNGMYPSKDHPIFNRDSHNSEDFRDHPRNSRYDSPFVNDPSSELGLPPQSLRNQGSGDLSKRGFGFDGGLNQPFGGGSNSPFGGGSQNPFGGFGGGSFI